MKAIGIVMLYDRRVGDPQEVSRKFFGENFSIVSEGLVSQELIDLIQLKDILDSKSIYWGGIKENFEKLLEDDEAIGRLAWKVFNDQSGKEASDEVKSLVYDGSKAPWKFTLMACVLYE
jgi:hypothetical protein